MERVYRLLLLGILVIGFGLSSSYLATTSPDVVLVDTISASEWGAPPIPNWKIEDIVMCENGTEAWAAAVGPGPFDDFLLFKITGISTSDPSVDQDSFIPFYDPYLGGEFPAGMGPRGTPGLAINVTCDKAYFPNFFLDTVNIVDLGAGEIGWEGTVLPAPVDVELTYPDSARLIVADSASNVVTVLDAASGDILAEIEVGFAPTSVPVVGKVMAMVANVGSRDIACIDLAKYEVFEARIPGLEVGPFQAVVSNAADRVYVSNRTSDTVTAYRARGCVLTKLADIPVGRAPRHIALSPDGRFLYVSNAIDKTVSVIDTRALAVVETIRPLDLAGLVTEDEPAPLGMVAVSKDNRHLFVYWEGGVVGKPGAFQLYYLDVSGLYGG